MTKRDAGDNDTPPGNESIGDAATELERDMASFESLTARVSGLSLGSQKEMLRAADLLEQATESHKSFLGHLRTLGDAVDRARARQNASAEALSAFAARLDERREAYAALQQRFAALGADAREITQLILASAGSNGDATEVPEEALAKVRVARHRLTLATEVARALVADSQQLELADLERQADSLRQQLESLTKKLRQIETTYGDKTSS